MVRAVFSDPLHNILTGSVRHTLPYLEASTDPESVGATTIQLTRSLKMKSLLSSDPASVGATTGQISDCLRERSFAIHTASVIGQNRSHDESDIPAERNAAAHSK